MRFLSIHARGLGAFTSELQETFNCDNSPSLVAISGPNGAGKTTLLELLLAGVYRQTPSRGSLISLAEGHRDALLEVEVDPGNGLGPITLRHTIDGVAGKADAVAIGADGTVFTPTGKVRDFDGWIAARVPPLGVMLATQFAAQGAGGFLAAKPAERKSLLLRMLGVELLEALAASARAQGTAAQGSIATLRRAAELEADGPTMQEATQRLRLAEERLASAQDSHRKAIAARDAQREQMEVFQKAQTWDRDDERLRQLVDALRERRQRLDDGLLTARASLRAKSDVDAAVAQLEVLEEEGREAAKAHEEAQRELAVLRAGVGNDENACTELEKRIDGLHTAVAIARQLPQREQAAEKASEGLRDAELFEACAARVLDDARSAQVTDATTRVGNLRGALVTITESTTTDPVFGIAQDAIDEDDRLVEATEALPGKIALAEKDRRDAAQQFRAARDASTAAEKALAEARGLASAPEELAAIRQQLHQVTERLAATRLAIASAETTVREKRAALDAARQAYTRTKQVASMAPRLAAAQAQLDAADGVNAEIERDLAAALQAQQQLGERPLAPPGPLDVVQMARQADAAVDAAALAVRATEEDVGNARATMESTTARERRRTALGQELARAEANIAEWTRLAADLGRNGLQAAVVDAALPELTTVANDLLAEAFGPRFALELRTQSVSASGKKMLETLDVLVHDAARRRVAPVETYSGGEKAILAEGLSLALTTLACRDAGLVLPTIIRDEAGAALDPERAREWMAMLRRAAQLIGASNVLFVSHTPACNELADLRIDLSRWAA